MATITLELPGGRSFEIAPFTFSDLELAAEHIDRLNDLSAQGRREVIDARRAAEEQGDPEAAAKATPKFATGTALFRAAIEIVAIGTAKIDPEMTADAIRRLVGFPDLAALQEAALAILSISGFSPQGEGKAPSRPATGAKRSARKSA